MINQIKILFCKNKVKEMFEKFADELNRRKPDKQNESQTSHEWRETAVIHCNICKNPIQHHKYLDFTIPVM